MDAARVFLVCIYGYALDKQRSERNMSGLTSELWMSRLVIIFVKWVEKYFQLVSEESFANQKKVFKENGATTLSENHVVRTKVSSACRDCIVTVLKFLLAEAHRWAPAFSNYFLLFSFFSNRIQKRFLHFLVKLYLTTTGISTDRLAQEGYVLVGYIFVGYSVLRPLDPHPILVTSRKK